MKILKEKLDIVKFKDFLSNQRDNIDQNKFSIVYDLCPSHDIPYLTKILYKAGIDPLLYLHDVPSNFCIYSGPKELILPKNILALNRKAFYKSNIEKIKLNDWIEEIPEYAFSKSDKLVEIEFSDKLKKIESDAFSDCINLKVIKLPKKLETIMMHAFNKCIHLTDIYVPKSCKIIWNSAFNGCIDLKNIYYEGSEEEWSIFKNIDINQNVTVHYNSY